MCVDVRVRFTFQDLRAGCGIQYHITSRHQVIYVQLCAFSLIQKYGQYLRFIFTMSVEKSFMRTAMVGLLVVGLFSFCSSDFFCSCQ